jgi:hypothetical protein
MPEEYSSQFVPENIFQFQGDVVNKSYDVGTGTVSNFTPDDFANHTATLVILDYKKVAVISINTGNGITLNSPQGRVTYEVPGTLPVGDYTYRLTIIPPNLKQYTLFAGEWRVA